MRQTTALIWKEYREHRWFLVAAGGLAFGLPLLITVLTWLVHGSFYYSDTSEVMVLCGGGMLAVILAIGATCRDLRENLHAFWASRPIGPTRTFLMKYAAGLAVLLVVTCGTLILQLAIQRPGGPRGWQSSQSAQILIFHSFTLILIYSVSFFLGCLVRHMARAAIISILAGLLIYLVPTVVPGLGRLSVYNLILTSQPRAATASEWFGRACADGGPFVAVMLVGSALSVLLACLAVCRGWHLEVDKESDKRYVRWAFAVLLLTLWVGAGFQLGSNLACENQFPLPQTGIRSGRTYVRIEASDGPSGVLRLSSFRYDKPRGHASHSLHKFERPRRHVSHSLCKFDGSCPLRGEDVGVE